MPADALMVTGSVVAFGSSSFRRGSSFGRVFLLWWSYVIVCLWYCSSPSRSLTDSLFDCLRRFEESVLPTLLASVRQILLSPLVPNAAARALSCSLRARVGALKLVSALLMEWHQFGPTAHFKDVVLLLSATIRCVALSVRERCQSTRTSHIQTCPDAIGSFLGFVWFWHRRKRNWFFRRARLITFIFRDEKTLKRVRF